MPDTAELLETTLAPSHKALGARMVEFGGWNMPVSYSSILEEHRAVREKAGLFDISHMGQIFVSGAGAEAWLNTTLTNDVRRLSVGHGQYTLMLNESGGTVDDLIIYRLEDLRYLLLVNASRIEDDFTWLNRRKNANITLENLSPEFGGLALQGPESETVLRRSFDEEKRPLKRNQLLITPFEGLDVILTRTGYTGEDGFELFASNELLPKLWDRLLAEGKPLGLQPCGLGARDTLRLEACYPLYGHELDSSITPLEAGLGSFLCFDKPEKFVGIDVLRKQKQEGLSRKSVALQVLGNGAPPRAQYPVLKDGQRIGEVTSGSHSPTLKRGIALALIDSAHAEAGTLLEILVRERPVSVQVVKKPFYRSSSL
ncbi:MAG: glycine cleavage system aminomethyltransferase GcvT [Blastochloris sp.]|nr:glycine cleavage system aminomethyltransferase GcvT [Blastochloris sp.]